MSICPKSILIYASCRREANFFLRFQHAAYKLQYKIYFLTDKYSVYRFIDKNISHSNQVLYVMKNKLKNLNHVKIDFSNDLEIKLGIYSNKEAQEMMESCWYTLYSLDAIPFDYILMWNGYRILNHILRVYAKYKNINTLYFEIANFEGKIFVDPNGTNAFSSLQKNPKILEDFIVDMEEYYRWKDNFIDSKMHQKSIKQASHLPLYLSGKDYFFDILGRVGYRGGVAIELPFKRIKKRLFKTHVKMDSIDVKDTRYVFFPLQVSTDSQIVINANYSLAEALKISFDIAKQNNAYLVIKPHPAEQDLSYISGITRLKAQSDKILFTNDNTYKLIKNAIEVVTINSTVGLESLIMGKKTKILGKAFYESFTELDVARYIMGFLINEDYWGTGNISENIFREILSRVKYCSLGYV